MGKPSETLGGLIRDRQAKAGIIGMGYVGLPLAVAAHEAGFPVIGFDIDKARVKMLNEGRSQ
ncbi:MAG: NAD(P)-binding domain-containing protein, partial [Flavobacteriaceae bacterium]